MWRAEINLQVGCCSEAIFLVLVFFFKKKLDFMYFIYVYMCIYYVCILRMAGGQLVGVGSPTI